MHELLREAYYDYLDDLARAGIIDHALNDAVAAGKPVEEHIVDVLRAAGRLPEGWDREADRTEPPVRPHQRAG
jgi:hypothetical protein